MICELRDFLREYKQRVFEKYGLEIESRLPEVVGTKVYTGQWVGVVSIPRYNICLVFEPKIGHEFLNMLDVIYGSTVRDLLHLVTAHTYLITTHERTGEALILPQLLTHVLRLIQHYIQSEPWYILQYIPSKHGTLVKVSPSDLALLKPKQIFNTRKYTTLLATLVLVYKALANIIGIVSEVSTRSDFLRSLGERLRTLTTSLISTITTEMSVPALVSYAELGEVNIDFLERIATLIQLTPSYRPGLFELLLYPSTKVYELYVLSKVLEVLSKEFREHPVLEQLNVIRLGPCRLYLNKAPCSKLVKSISGSLPRPDIAVVTDNKVIVLEAKYRDLSRKLLRLSDTLRLLAYIIDVAKDRALRAAITCLGRARYPPRIETYFNDVSVDLFFIVVRPRYFEENLLREVIVS